MSSKTPKPRLARIRDAIQYTSFSRSTIYRAIETGELNPLKLGHSVRIEFAELDRWIDAKSQPQN